MLEWWNDGIMIQSKGKIKKRCSSIIPLFHYSIILFFFIFCALCGLSSFFMNASSVLIRVHPRPIKSFVFGSFSSIKSVFICTTYVQILKFLLTKKHPPHPNPPPRGGRGGRGWFLLVAAAPRWVYLCPIRFFHFLVCFLSLRALRPLREENLFLFGIWCFF